MVPYLNSRSENPQLNFWVVHLCVPFRPLRRPPVVADSSAKDALDVELRVFTATIIPQKLP